MGGSLALHYGYRFCPDIAGIFALSSFLYKNSAVYQVISELYMVFWSCNCEQLNISCELNKLEILLNYVLYLGNKGFSISQVVSASAAVPR